MGAEQEWFLFFCIDDMPDLEAICKSAQRLNDRLQKSVAADMHEMWSEMSRMSLTMVLSCMLLVFGKLFSRMAVFSWGYATRRPMSKLVTRAEFGKQQVSSCPNWLDNICDIFQSVREGTQALWHFASAAELIVLDQVPAPTTSQVLAVASRHDDKLSSNL